MLNICLALLPVLLLLCGLLLMDSFKLLRPSSLAMALAWGAAVALMNQPLDDWLLSGAGIDLRTLTRYAAPVAEEILKAALIVVLLARRRIGFLIDAAVLGITELLANVHKRGSSSDAACLVAHQIEDRPAQIRLDGLCMSRPEQCPAFQHP